MVHFVQTSNRLTIRSHFRLTVFYLVWSALLVVFGTVNLLKVMQQIGQTFGGFMWTQDPTREHAFYVGWELWRTLPPAPDRIALLDEIVSIDGKSPWTFEQVYETAEPGELITYEVRRHNQYLVIREPVRIFTWDMFALSHGLLYLAGFSFVLVGYVLLRSARRQDSALFALALLFGGGAWFSHSTVAGIHTSYTINRVSDLLLYVPTMPMVGALLMHFALIFPEPNHLIRRLPGFPYLNYVLAGALIVGYALTWSYSLARWHNHIYAAMAIYAILGIVSLVASSAVVYRQARRKRIATQRQVIEALAAVWLVGLIIFAVLGILPVLFVGYPLLPAEVLFTLVLLFPLILIYAMRNAEMINRMHQEVTLRQQYADQVKELQNIRERTLHEVADALHDQVIPGLRGLHLAATAAQRRARQLGAGALIEDLAFLSDTLNAVSGDVRIIMEGAKPVDWTETELGQTLRWFIDDFQRNNRDLDVSLEMNEYDEADGPVVKEALYWITRAALSNVQDHAQAATVVVSLHSNAETIRLCIEDNGMGFDVDAENGGVQDVRRHLGLVNMRLRAAEIGAELQIESSPGIGTRVEAMLLRLEGAR